MYALNKENPTIDSKILYYQNLKLFIATKYESFVDSKSSTYEDTDKKVENKSSSSDNLIKESENEKCFLDEETQIQEYMNDMLSVIKNDYFEDGIQSRSENYIIENFNESTSDLIKKALMRLYHDNVSDSHILTGILLMIGSVPYSKIEPEGPIMALGLLQNVDISIRDRAIQAFERWNSKKDLSVLRSLKCDRKWLQRYVDKVIKYIEKDGID